MIQELLKLTHWVTSLTSEEVADEIEKIKTTISAQKETGKIDLMTNIKAHMLIERQMSFKNN